MQHYTYILHSQFLNKFYIGATSLTPDERLLKHLQNHKGYTANAKDWTIVYFETFESLNEARKRELQLKKWKSHQRISQLINRSSTQ